jgi:hypothetical protein
VKAAAKPVTKPEVKAKLKPGPKPNPDRVIPDKSSKSVSSVLGFTTCPICGGEAHVMRIDADNKRAYSHCIDSLQKDCMHNHHAANAAQEAMMLAKMRPLKPTDAVPVVKTKIVTVVVPAPAPPRRRGLFFA